MTNHVRLPAERIEQLRQIAEVRQQTIPEVIADFVRAEIAKGTIPDTVPGVEVTADSGEITIRSRDGFSAAFSTGDGPTLADLLREGSNLPGADPERKKRWLEGAAALTGIRVKRAGNGLKIISPQTGREFPLNLDVAADLGGQIAKATK